MRSRVTHLACLLLLLSSLAMSDVRAGNGESARTPGGVFVRNLLMQVTDDAETEPADYEDGAYAVAEVTARPQPAASFCTENCPSKRTARVHAVTGSSL